MDGLDLTPLLRSTLAQPEAVTAADRECRRDPGRERRRRVPRRFRADRPRTAREPRAARGAAAQRGGGLDDGRARLSHPSAGHGRAPEGIRLWVPIFEGSDRSGVLAVTLPDEDPERIRACEALGVLAGYLLTVNGRVSDLFNLHRRRKAMTLAASLQWDLLPPLVFKSPPVTVAGILEPAYEVGGDCFDYSINWPVLDIALMDSMGHGLNSAILASLALGCYRHDRRHGKSLMAMHQELESDRQGPLRRQGVRHRAIGAAQRRDRSTAVDQRRPSLAAPRPGRAGHR